MAKRKEGCKVVFVEAPTDLVERLKAVAKLNHRSMSGETIVAIERHVEAEERVQKAARHPADEQAADKGKRKKGEDHG